MPCVSNATRRKAVFCDIFYIITKNRADDFFSKKDLERSSSARFLHHQCIHDFGCKIAGRTVTPDYSTVTDFARLRGLSMSQPLPKDT